jgi:hypothetical protein
MDAGGLGGAGGTHDGGGLGGSGGQQAQDAAVSCTYTVTGAATASGTCTIMAAYDQSMGSVDVSFTGSTNHVSFGGGILGKTTLTAGTYTLADAPEAGATFLVGLTSEWGMCNNGGCEDGMSNPIPNFGTFTLVITDPGPAQFGMLWSAPHGTLHVNMPSVPNTTSSGTVQLDATF